jgi:outer membrane usher protein
MYSNNKPCTCQIFSLLLLLWVLAMAIFASQVQADDYFNPALLDIDNPQQTRTDLSVYEKGRDKHQEISGFGLYQ